MAWKHARLESLKVTPVHLWVQGQFEALLWWVKH